MAKPVPVIIITERLCLNSQNCLTFRVDRSSEIVGCYLPWLVLKQGKSAWLLLAAALSLAVFVWLLTLHPTAAGRTYAAYGGMYIVVALSLVAFHRRDSAYTLGCGRSRHCVGWYGTDCNAAKAS